MFKIIQIKHKYFSVWKLRSQNSIYFRNASSSTNLGLGKTKNF